MYFRKDWNYTGVPLAYLFTFRTYGTWLHGDPKGSIDRNNNIFGEPYYPPDREWSEMRRKSLKQSPVKLNKDQRKTVESSIEDTCQRRNWGLLARNARTNHVHSVVNIGEANPSKALNALKANATRELRDTGQWKSKLSPWVRKGSKRRLWNDEDVWNAVNYVNNQ